MLGLFFLAKPSVGTEVKPVTFAPAGVWIKLNINLHRPKKNCESGFGLCFLVSWGFETASGSAESNLCPARGMLNDRNQLLIEIEEASLSRYEGGSSLPNFRDKTSVDILDPFTLPESTSRLLGSDTAVTIKPGTYPVLYKNSAYTIVFQL